MPLNDDAFERNKALKRLLLNYRFFVERAAVAPAVRFAANWKFLSFPQSPEALRRAEIWDSAVDFADGVFPVRLPWLADTIIELRSASELARQIYVGGDFDPNEFAFLDVLLRDGMTFLDVGANIGAYALFAARKVGPRGAVIAFEPSSREFAALASNIALNRLANVQAHQVAAGLADGRAQLKIAPAAFGGLNSLYREIRTNDYPNIRYRTNLNDYVWESFEVGEKRIPLKGVSELELFIYADRAYEFDLRQIRIEPATAVEGPWRMAVPGELQITPPRAVLSGRAAECAVLLVGAIRIIEVENGIRLVGSPGSGVMLRWTLDPASSQSVSLAGQPAPPDDAEVEDVSVVSLDSFLAGRSFASIDVLKLDIEGGEADALSGGMGLIRKYQPLILAELAGGGKSDGNSTRSAAIFDELGYRLFDLSGGIPRLTQLAELNGSNVVAAPERFVDQILTMAGVTRAAPKSSGRK